MKVLKFPKGLGKFGIIHASRAPSPETARTCLSGAAVFAAFFSWKGITRAGDHPLMTTARTMILSRHSALMRVSLSLLWLILSFPFLLTCTLFRSFLLFAH